MVREFVMAGLGPAIHFFGCSERFKTWMPDVLRPHGPPSSFETLPPVAPQDEGGIGGGVASHALP